MLIVRLLSPVTWLKHERFKFRFCEEKLRNMDSFITSVARQKSENLLEAFFDRKTEVHDVGCNDKFVGVVCAVSVSAMNYRAHLTR